MNKGTKWAVGALVTVAAIVACLFVVRLLCENAMRSALDSLVQRSTSMKVIWHGWHPNDFHERGFELEGQVADEFVDRLNSHLGIAFAPGRSMARPTLHIYFFDESGGLMGRVNVRMSVDSKAIETIDPVANAAMRGRELDSDEIHAATHGQIRPTSSFLDLEFVAKKRNGS